MKHTKSMIYLFSDESRELALYAANNGKLYRERIVPVVRNLARYYSKGKFDRDKAVDAFFPIATEAARMYCKEFASANAFGNVFDVTARFTAADDLVDDYMENIIKNDL